MKCQIPFLRLWVLAGIFAVLLPALHGLALTASAQPELTESDPDDGAVLDAPPESIHVCFSESVLSGGYEDFEFVVLAPGDQRLGLRIVFEEAGGCADILPGQPSGDTGGTWEVQWQVTSRADSETGSGSFQFTVDITNTPSAQDPEPEDNTPGAQDPASEDTGDGDIPLLAIILAAAGGGAAVLSLIIYLWMRRRQFWTRR